MGIQRALTNWFPKPFHRCHNREAGRDAKELKIAVWGNKDWVEGGMVRAEEMTYWGVRGCIVYGDLGLGWLVNEWMLDMDPGRGGGQ